MLYLGLNTNNSMVVDDYYKEGKAINQRIERDRTAALLGLQASIYNADNRLAIDLSTHAVAFPPQLNELALVAQKRFATPSAIQLRWVHVTQAEKDGQMTLLPIGGSRFISHGTLLPQHGKYRLHIQPPDSAAWRLVSPLTELTHTQSLTVSAPEPDDVFDGSDIN